MRRSARAQRRLVGAVAVVVLVLAGVSIALAWLQYENARTRDARDLEARVAAIGALIDTAFTGEISTLEAIAGTPAVVDVHVSDMNAYFARLDLVGRGKLFSGGITWIDRRGRIRASSTAEGLRIADLVRSVSEGRVLATRRPYVSAGVLNRRTRHSVVVVVVPTFDRSQHVSGVLAGSVLLGNVRENKRALDLGYGQLEIIDRRGQLLLSHLAPVANRRLLERIGQAGNGVETDTPGLDGRGRDVVAFATAKVPGWVAVIDRPRSSVFAAARSALILEVASAAGGALLVLSILGWMARRTRLKREANDEWARAWSELAAVLTSAATPAQVADALLAAVADAFRDAIAIVALERDGRIRVRASSHARRARRFVENEALLDRIAGFSDTVPTSRVVAREPALRGAPALSREGFGLLKSFPLLGERGDVAGSIFLLAPRRLDSSERTQLERFADQAGLALERAHLFADEHALSVRLQRSLLPLRLPEVDGVALAARYAAGDDAVDVGGDWYDAMRRPDGILELCIGDVSGRGVGAAVVMGNHRASFRILAQEHASSSEIMRRMRLYSADDVLVTAACVGLDPYVGELWYACAGHPPPLLVDRSSGRVVRLDRAGGPPLGVAVPADVVEARVPLPESAALVLYTDGLIERRGRNLDDGIEALARVIASEPEVTPDVILGGVRRSLGTSDDDLALLVVTLDGPPARFEVEAESRPSSLHDIRRRLRAWLARRGVSPDDSADILVAAGEACNNVIEHAYGVDGGTFRLCVDDDGQALRVVVEDRGSWRRPTPTPDRGRGIVLMKGLMDTAEILGDASGTRVTLTRARAAALVPGADE